MDSNFYSILYMIIFSATCIPYYNQRLYEEWGCQPKTLKGRDCPIGFSCPQLWDRPNNTCFVSGKIYNPNDLIETDGIGETCLVSCRCSK